MSASDVVSIALAEVGYLEKKSAAYLDDKTANAGSANYNKYARDIWPSLQAQPWCDIFVSWCGMRAGELAAVGKYAYCPSHVAWFKNQGKWIARGNTPKPGDIIFFQSGGEACHVGIVEYAASGYVHTIEGNASGASGLTPNGGGVCKKSYSLGSSYILGYGRPAYKAASAETGTAVKPAASSGKTEKIFYPWRSYKNGSSVEPVYKDTDFATMTGSLDPGESCYCLGVYGGAYLVCYKVGGFSDRWAVGYVKYAGGVS